MAHEHFRRLWGRGDSIGIQGSHAGVNRGHRPSSQAADGTRRPSQPQNEISSSVSSELWPPEPQSQGGKPRLVCGLPTAAPSRDVQAWSSWVPCPPSWGCPVGVTGGEVLFQARGKYTKTHPSPTCPRMGTDRTVPNFQDLSGEQIPLPSRPKGLSELTDLGEMRPNREWWGLW